MDQISEHKNSPNQNNSYDQMIKNIVNLGSKKCENKDTSSFQLAHL